jgi:hypothetical protein
MHDRKEGTPGGGPHGCGSGAAPVGAVTHRRRNDHVSPCMTARRARREAAPTVVVPGHDREEGAPGGGPYGCAGRGMTARRARREAAPTVVRAGA